MSDSQKPHAIPSGPEHSLQIYTLGLGGGKPSVPVPLDLLEKKAKEILSPRAYDYVAGGAGGAETMRPNPAAVSPWRSLPRRLRGGSQRGLCVRTRWPRVPRPRLLC